jgi:hypothetical protein
MARGKFSVSEVAASALEDLGRRVAEAIRIRAAQVPG